MNLGAFRNVVSLKTGIQNSGTEQALIDEFVNRGVLRVSQDILPNVQGSTITMVDGTRVYTLASLVLIDAFYDGSPPITRLPLGELIAMRSASGGASAARITHYALAGLHSLYVFPTPSASPPALQIVHNPIPTALSLTSDDPSTGANGNIPTEYQFGIQLWALREASDAIDAEEQANGYLQQYEAWLNRAREDVWKRGGQIGKEGLSQVPLPTGGEQ